MRNTGHVRVAKSYSADKNLIPNFLVLSLLLCLTGLTAACGSLSQGASTSTTTSSGQNTPAGQLGVSIPSGQATVGVAYSAVASVSGGSAPYFFSISAGSLPPGLVLNRTTGSITGIPLVAGTYNSVLWVSDPLQRIPAEGVWLEFYTIWLEFYANRRFRQQSRHHNLDFTEQRDHCFKRTAAVHRQHKRDCEYGRDLVSKRRNYFQQWSLYGA